MPLKLTFLGTNGWYPTGTGNTVCALLELPDRYIVLDAGDGLHKLDEYATDQGKPIDIFLSHFHLDHVYGLHIQPKFSFKPEMRIFVQAGTKEALNRLINHPYSAPFPAPKTKISVHELKEGKNAIAPPNGVKGQPYAVHCLPLVHADPCWGFRFEFANGAGGKKTISYCTDTGPCDNMVKLSEGADLLITECSLLPGEPVSQSWPHMSPEAAARLANEAGCRKLILTHFAAHNYSTHEKRQEAKNAAARTFPNSEAAIDGMEIDL